MVWVCTVCILLFAMYRIFYGEADDKRHDIYGETLGSKGQEVTLQGRVDRIETKTTSYYLYLNDVSVDGSRSGIASTHLSRIILSFRQEPDVLPGNRIQANGTLCNFDTATNPGQFDARSYYQEQGIYYIMYTDGYALVSGKTDRYRAFLFRLHKHLLSVIQDSLPEKQAGIIMTMLLGDKSALNPEIRQLYRQNGIGHLFAVSGLHVTILCMAFYQLLLWLRLPRSIAVSGTLCVLWSYGVMTGFSVSTNRAVIMMILYLFSGIAGRSYDLLSAMACSALVILLQNPFAIHSCSFLLSYTAILGVGLVYPVLQECILGDETARRRHRRNLHRTGREQKAKGWLGVTIWWFVTSKEKLLQTLLMSVAIQISTLPVLLYFYYEVPTYGVILNIFVLPLASLLLLLAMAAALTGLCFLSLAKFLFGAVSLILGFYENLCMLFLKLPMPVTLLGRPSYYRIGGYILFATVAVWLWQKFRTRRVPLYLWAAGTILLVFPVISPNFSMTFLDVGQGDGVVIHTPDDTIFLIDGGSTSENQVGEYRIKPFLKYYGIREIDYMIMSHADEDHISGQIELLQHSGQPGEIRIKQLLLPEPSAEYQAEKGYQNMLSLAEKAHVPVSYIHTGDTLHLQELEILCLHPDAGFGGESANAYSTSLSITWQGYHFLLCGDLEGAGEEAVLERLQNGQEGADGTRRIPESYDVLKVSHHGSKNSTSEAFLKTIRPSLAVISCGQDNRYGHPHPELLQRLEQEDAQILRTDQQGSIKLVLYRDRCPPVIFLKNGKSQM